MDFCILIIGHLWILIMSQSQWDFDHFALYDLPFFGQDFLPQLASLHPIGGTCAAVSRLAKEYFVWMSTLILSLGGHGWPYNLCAKKVGHSQLEPSRQKLETHNLPNTWHIVWHTLTIWTAQKAVANLVIRQRESQGSAQELSHRVPQFHLEKVPGAL